MSNLQNALNFPPASVVATSILEAKASASKDVQVQAVAGFMKAIEALGDCKLKVLTAINPQMIADRAGDYQHLELPAGMPDTQKDVVIQISAMNRRDCQFVQRLIHDVLTDHFDMLSETVGGDIFLNQEPFGFYHADPEEREKLKEVSEIASGQLKGGTWLLYQRWVQRLDNFYDQTQKQQLQTIGGDPVRTDFWDNVPPDTPIPADAHVKFMEPVGSLPDMIRRGFSYRKDGDEGVVFVATAANVATGFNQPLSKMASGDKVLGFADALEGGLYIVPSDGDWLDSSASAAPISASAEELLVRKANNQVLNMAEILATQEFLDLINELVGDILHPDHIDAQAKLLFQAVNERAAGGTLESVSVTGANPGRTQQLNSMLDISIEDAARFNEIAGKYVVTS